MSALRDFLFYEEHDIRIFCGDYRDVLPLIRDIDDCETAIVTDPPYGHAQRWRGGTWGANPIYRDAEAWDRETIPDLWKTVMFADELIIWGGNYYELPPSRCWLAWRKSSSLETMADFELAWTNLDRPARMFSEDRNPDGIREHPTQKPLSLMTWCLGFTRRLRVIDPFCGSGTTLEAAKLLHRRAIGIEIEPKYCEIAVQRLRQEVLAL